MKNELNLEMEYPCNKGEKPRDCGHCDAEHCPYIEAKATTTNSSGGK
jgi:hypothetical protein